jgi:hypothetical protein
VCDASHARRCAATGFTFKHNRIRDALSSLLTAHGIRHIKEDPTPFRNQPREYRMDITTMAGAFALSGHQRLLLRGALLDVTVVDPLSSLPRYSAHVRDGDAAARAHSRKVLHYQGKFNPASYHLWPLAVETYGRWGVAGEEFIDAFATHVVGGSDSASWRAKGAAAHSIRQHLAVTLQRAVSSVVMTHTHRRLALERPGGGDGDGDEGDAVSDAVAESL